MFIKEPTQSLSADQMSKIFQSRATPGLTIYAHQLDVIKKSPSCQAISNHITAILSEKETTIIH